MTNKYLLAGAVAAFLLIPQPACAPSRSRSSLEPKSGRGIVLGKTLEKIMLENEKRPEELRKKLEENRKRTDDLVNYRTDDLVNYRTDDFNDDSDQLLLARMIFGEAENCTEIEKIAVAYTAINRLKESEEYGKNLKEVILQPRQYSCFNEEFDSSIFLKDPLKHNEEEFLKCLKLAEEILDGKYQDPTNGAKYYYNPQTVEEPKWAKEKKKIGRIGNSHHIFYR